MAWLSLEDRESTGSLHREQRTAAHLADLKEDEVYEVAALPKDRLEIFRSISTLRHSPFVVLVDFQQDK